MNPVVTATARKFSWGHLQHHDADCDECGGAGTDEDGDECHYCDDGRVRWGSFYGDIGECDVCGEEADVAGMYDDGNQYVCLLCYLQDHRAACGCDRWSKAEDVIAQVWQPSAAKGA